MTIASRCTCGRTVQYDPATGKAPCPCKDGPPATDRAAPPPKSPERRTGPHSLPFQPLAKATKNTLTLWLPRGAKATEGLNGRSWRVRHRAKKEWQALVAAALEPIDWAAEAVRIEYVYLRRRGTKAHDRDNLTGCLKPVLDAIVRAGVVPDDTEDRVVDLKVTQDVSTLPWAHLVVRIRRARRKT